MGVCKVKISLSQTSKPVIFYASLFCLGRTQQCILFYFTLLFTLFYFIVLFYFVYF